MAKSNEPIWWSLFGAGGVVAALVIPAMIFITGLLIPFLDSGIITVTDSDGFTRSIRSIDEDYLLRLARSLIGRVFLFVVISLPLFHWAHRFRYTLADLGFHYLRTLVAVLCYGAAIVGTAVAGWLVCTL